MVIRRAIFLTIIVGLLLPTTGLAQIGIHRPIGVTVEAGGREPFFLEMWNNVAYYDTNLQKPNFASLLGRFEGKLGLNIFSLPVQVYGVYYTAASQSTAYYNNYLFSGVGARLIPFRDYHGDRWFNEWLPGTKIFYETLNASYNQNAASAESLAKQDVLYGVEIYHEWNQDNPDLKKPWGELWLKAMHRDTNFGWETFHTYVYFAQPKFGLHLNNEIGVYLRGDITGSGKNTPAYYYLNMLDYGVGIRFEPMRKYSKANDLLRKLKMYLEVLTVSYLNNIPPDPSNYISSDVRFGVEFSYGR
jgi:hypothetical protein